MCNAGYPIAYGGNWTPPISTSFAVTNTKLSKFHELEGRHYKLEVLNTRYCFYDAIEEGTLGHVQEDKDGHYFICRTSEGHLIPRRLSFLIDPGPSYKLTIFHEAPKKDSKDEPAKRT